MFETIQRFADWYASVRADERDLSPSRQGLFSLALGTGSTAGVTVTHDNALTISAFWACVKLLAESVAQLPLITYQRDGRAKYRAESHPIYTILKQIPNPEMTSFEFRETLMGHLTTWGNAYAEIEWGGNGMVRALWPLRPDAVDVQRHEGELVYDVWNGDHFLRLPSYRVLHLRGFGYNGLLGYSPVRVHAETLGYSFATKAYGAQYFGNGSRPGIIIKTDKTMSEEAQERFRSRWEAMYNGLDNAQRVAILQDGTDFETVGIPPEEAQFLETQKYQVVDIARIFGVQPHKIMALENATFSNIEEQSMEFVRDTLKPWVRRWEQTLYRSLLIGAERDHFFFEFLLDELLAGNTEARHAAHASAIQNGWKTPNEVRIAENLNPYPGGDTFIMPLNMVQVDASGAIASAGTGTDERNGDRCACGCDDKTPHVETRADDADDQLRSNRQALARAHIRLFEDAAGRLVRREVADLRRALASKGAAFGAWIDEFYADLRGVIPTYFEATMMSLAEQVVSAVGDELGDETDVSELFVTAYLEAYAGAYVASHNRQLAALVDEAADEDEAAELVAARLDGWADTQPGKEAKQQAYEATNALAVNAYKTLGVAYLRWMASGASCDFCRSLNGKTVGIKSFFVLGGDSVTTANGASMLVRRNKRYGPLHKGCDCIVTAA